MEDGAAACSCSAKAGKMQPATTCDDQMKEGGSASRPASTLLAKFDHSLRYLLDLCVDLVVLQLAPRRPVLQGAGSACPLVSANEDDATLPSGLDNSRQSLQQRCSSSSSSNFTCENANVLLSHLRSIDQLFDIVHQTFCQIVYADRESTDKCSVHLQKRPQEKLQDEAESMESHQVSLSQKLEMYKTHIMALRHTMERAEIVHAQHTLAESGSYEDSSVTPPLLQSGADAVKTAIAVCASDFLASTKTKSISLQLAYLGLVGNTHFNSGASSVKVALQAFFCRLVFDGADQPAMYTWPSSPTDTSAMFERPEQRKRRLFEAYKKFRSCEPQEVQHQNEEFNRFVLTKAHAFMHKHLSMLIVAAGDEQRHQLHRLVGSEILNNRDNAFHGSFLRLMKAVWLVRLLACAMHPNAEMFWVGTNVKFDEEFMEDAGLLPEADEPIKCSGDLKRVSFMCVPGFTVRRSIIKAQVYLTS